MPSPQTRLYTSLAEDCKQFHYKDPVKNKYGSRNAYINKNRDESVRPRYQMAAKTDAHLRAPYGISEPFDEKQKDTDRKSLDITIESDALKNALDALDEHNIKTAFENCEKWFGKKLTMDHIRLMYKPIVTLPKEGKSYKPTFRTKVNLNPNEANATRFFAIEEGENGIVRYVEKDHSVLGKGSGTVPVIEIGSLWFAQTQFGMTLESTEIIVFPTRAREEFPFQWGDDKAVPMDTEETTEQTSNTPPPVDNGYVPPQAPSN